MVGFSDAESKSDCAAASTGTTESTALLSDREDTSSEGSTQISL